MIRYLQPEGGATASAVLQRLLWTRFQLVHEYAPGIVSPRISEADAPRITVKPGSYPWVYPFPLAGA